ncbi:MAG: MarR family transcriptional regulator [Methylomonas lenta]|nr:MarR family transcriptional regulator [Methylomonas lenta]
MSNTIQHRDAYKQALRSKDEASLLIEKAWLTTTAASAMLNQETVELSEILACCSDLAPLADHYDFTGKPGDHWRALSDILTLAMQSGKPLQQLRLVLPSTVSGLLIKHINDQPGITSKALADRCQKTAPHISNEIKKLERAGLIYRKKHGRERALFLSKLGKDALDDTKPIKIVVGDRSPLSFPHADQDRLNKLTHSGMPTLPFSQAMP